MQGMLGALNLNARLLVVHCNTRKVRDDDDVSPNSGVDERLRRWNIRAGKTNVPTWREPLRTGFFVSFRAFVLWCER